MKKHYRQKMLNSESVGGLAAIGTEITEFSDAITCYVTISDCIQSIQLDFSAWVPMTDVNGEESNEYAKRIIRDRIHKAKTIQQELQTVIDRLTEFQNENIKFPEKVKEDQ